MAGYNRVDPFSPLGDAGTGATPGMGPGGGFYESPATYPQTWGSYHGDLGSPEIEMHETSRPGMPNQQSQSSMHSEFSTSSTIFPSKATPKDVERQSFLPDFRDPIHRMDTSFNAKDVPYKDPHARQFKMILLGMSTRWFVTAGLCAAFVVSTFQWRKRGPQSENQKKIYNAVTTGISICLGLNIASAFKDIALNMRWVILAQKKRSLKEVDLILSIDSMLRVAKLVFISRKPMVVLAGAAWLFINILAQTGIAMISLTYGWETATDGVLMRDGSVTIPVMDHFYPQGTSSNDIITPQDEAYTAHLYGGLPNNYGINDTEIVPKAGTIFPPSRSSLFTWDTDNRIDFFFTDSPSGLRNAMSTYSVVTSRKVSSTYACDVHPVIKGGNGTAYNITVGDGIQDVFVSHKAPNSTTFFTNKPNGASNRCKHDPRCSVVEAFEASNSHAWYYKCNITIAKTMNDPRNISWVSDHMASIATSAIAQVGYTDDGQEAQIYPQGSDWGYPMNGSAEYMGRLIAIYGLGSLASAAIYNPTTNYTGSAPGQGASLNVGHSTFFSLILGLICGCHLLFVVLVAVLANKAKIGPDTHLEMSLLLRPIADQLEGVRSNGKVNEAYYKVITSTKARYERAENDRWVLKTS